MPVPPAPRVLLDLDARVVCARLRPAGPDGSATPIVLAAGGAGQGTGGTWGPSLEALLASVGPVVTYDRAGSGRSDGPPHDTVAGMAEELEEVTDAFGLREPAVLVGWSLGAFAVQGYLLRRPEAVAGVVFVDPTPVEPPPRSTSVQLQRAATKPLMRTLGLASRAGLFSGPVGDLVAGLMARAGGTPQAAALALRFLRDPDALDGQLAMMDLVPRYAAELEHALASASLPDVPTTVITAGERGTMPQEYVANVRASHERLAARFPRGRVVTAERAGHQLPFDDPDVVAEAVRTIVAGL